jgi:molybdopterin synthase sulfur carrier subunit
MQKIDLRLFGHLRKYHPGGVNPGSLAEVSEGCSVGDLLDQLGIPPDDPKIILVNGIHADRQHPIQEGDRVSIFPPIAGG